MLIIYGYYAFSRSLNGAIAKLRYLFYPNEESNSLLTALSLLAKELPSKKSYIV